MMLFCQCLPVQNSISRPTKADNLTVIVPIFPSDWKGRMSTHRVKGWSRTAERSAGHVQPETRRPRDFASRHHAAAFRLAAINAPMTAVVMRQRAVARSFPAWRRSGDLDAASLPPYSPAKYVVACAHRPEPPSNDRDKLFAAANERRICQRLLRIVTRLCCQIRMSRAQDLGNAEHVGRCRKSNKTKARSELLIDHPAENLGRDSLLPQRLKLQSRTNNNVHRPSLARVAEQEDRCQLIRA